MKHCVGKHIVHARVSVQERSLTVGHNICSVGEDLHDTVSGQSVLHYSSFDVSRVTPARDVLLLP